MEWEIAMRKKKKNLTSLRDYIKSEVVDCMSHYETIGEAFVAFIAKLDHMVSDNVIIGYNVIDEENRIVEIQPYFSPLPVWEVKFASDSSGPRIIAIIKGCLDPENYQHWRYINTVPGEHGEDEQTERCLMCDKEMYKRFARDMEQAVDNVRETLRLESTHWMVIHNEVEDVMKERDALRSALDKAHHWLMNLIQTNDKKQHNHIMTMRPDGADLADFHRLLNPDAVKCPACGTKRLPGDPTCPCCGNVSLEECDRCGGEGEIVLGCALCGKIKLKRRKDMPKSFEKRKLNLKKRKN